MKQGRRRLSRRVVMVCGVILAGVFFIWLVVQAPAISIPLDGFRSTVQTVVSQELGQDVLIEGALSLRLTLGPAIVAHDVRIARPQGQGELLRAGRVTVRLAPVALLRGEPRNVRLLIEDASIDMDIRTKPGKANAALLASQAEFQEMILHRVVLNYRDDRSVQPYPLKLDEIRVHNRRGQPLELMIRGRFQQQPYSIDLTGGQLADLLTPTGPWPVRAGVVFANSRVFINGNLEAFRQGLVMPFELRVDWPAELARLAAHFGPAPLAGRLSLLADQGRPVVAGELQLPTLDAVLRFGDGAGPARDAADQATRGGGEPDDSFAGLPLTVSIADVPFHGQLSVAGEDTEAVVELALSATDAKADGLLANLTGSTGIQGRFQHVGLKASARGRGDTGILNRVAVALQVEGARLSYGNTVGERPVNVSLDELALILPAGESVMVRARGALLEEPFSVEFEAGGLQALLVDETWPVTLSAMGGGAVLDVSGPLAVAHADTPTRLHVGLYGERLGDLAAWLSVSPCAAAPYTLRGQLVLAEDVGRLQFLQVQAGRTRFNGELDWSGDEQIALLHAVLHFEQLDPADIEALIPLVSQEADEDAARGVAIDMPVLPERVEIINADIDLAIEHILLELLDISEVSLSARIREGKLQRSPFHTHIGNASFQGYLDPATAETGVVFEDEEDDGAAGGRMDKLFSSVVRWVGGSAVVPLRWMFKKKFLTGDLTECPG